MNPLDSFRLDDRTVIVTGATSGLGLGFAHAVAAAGGRVVLAGRRVERLDQAVRDLVATGATAVAKQTDVSDPASCAALADFAVAEFGTIHGLVNNAGVGQAKTALKSTVADF